MHKDKKNEGRRYVTWICNDILNIKENISLSDVLFFK